MQHYRSLGIILYMIFAIIGGWTADVTNSKSTALIGTFFITIISLVNCYMIDQNTLCIPLYLSTCALLPFVTMPALTLLQSSIPKVIRYRLFSLAHSIGAIAISAPSSSIATILFEKTKISWLPNIYFILILLLMTLAMMLLFAFKEKLEKEKPQEE
jgi:MHS family proline/betaine transporter-like MFS transporter